MASRQGLEERNRDLKVGTESNLADALTKAVDARAIEKHVEGIGAVRKSDRHRIAPKVVQSDSLQYESEE